MSFIVSARKYRPQQFGDVAGQDHVTRTLKNAITLGRVAHAYLFTGPRGVGKTTTARILAKSINCERPIGVEPCNECAMCLSISNGQLIDVIEIDAASNRGIDDVRALIDSVRYPPSRGKYKIYIIDEVHMLTKDSFNALLKTLEEPPEYTVFIFATTDVHKVPLTILSRCQRYDFRRIQLDVIRMQLRMIAESEEISIDDKTLMLIARKADGALRDAESYFDQVVAFSGKNVVYEIVTQLLNVIDDELLFSVTNAILNKDFQEAFRISEALYSNGWNYPDFLDRLIEHFRNVMVIAATGSFDLVETADEFKPHYAKFAKEFSQSDLLRLVTFLSKVQNELKFAPNQRLKIEIALSQLIGFEKTLTISKLVSSQPVQAAPQVRYPAAPAKPAVSQAAPPTPGVREQIPAATVSQTEEKRAPAETVFDQKPKAAVVQQPATEGKQLTLETIIERWQVFCQTLVKARKMTFSGIVQFIWPHQFERNTLTLEVSDPDSFPLFSQQEKLFTDIFSKVFERKVNFKFVLSPNGTATGRPPVTIPAQEPLPGAPQSPEITGDDPYIDFIKNQLGGERVN
jgi:DNA polymerase-3 subunit gamma/tau